MQQQTKTLLEVRSGVFAAMVLELIQLYGGEATLQAVRENLLQQAHINDATEEV